LWSYSSCRGQVPLSSLEKATMSLNTHTSLPLFPSLSWRPGLEIIVIQGERI
jgi:hypothetical protein